MPSMCVAAMPARSARRERGERDEERKRRGEKKRGGKEGEQEEQRGRIPVEAVTAIFFPLAFKELMISRIR